MVRDAAKYLFYQIQLKLTWVHRWPRIGPKARSATGPEQGHRHGNAQGTPTRTPTRNMEAEQGPWLC